MPDDEYDRWIRSFLTGDEIEILRQDFPAGPGRTPRDAGPLDLLEAWRLHVLRIKSELSRPATDRSTWGAYDLVAAVTIRGRIADWLTRVPATQKAGYQQALDDVDRTFTGFTERDESKILCALDGREPTIGQWWWECIPRTGPIRQEIEEIRDAWPCSDDSDSCPDETPRS